MEALGIKADLKRLQPHQHSPWWNSRPSATHESCGCAHSVPHHGSAQERRRFSQSSAVQKNPQKGCLTRRNTKMALLSFVAGGLVLGVHSATPTVEIAPGVHMPRVNLGTWQLGNGQPSDPSIGVSQLSHIRTCMHSSVHFALLWSSGRRHSVCVCVCVCSCICNTMVAMRGTLVHDRAAYNAGLRQDGSMTRFHSTRS